MFEVITIILAFISTTLGYNEPSYEHNASNTYPAKGISGCYLEETCYTKNNILVCNIVESYNEKTNMCKFAHKVIK